MAPCELAAGKWAGRHGGGFCWWAAQAEGSAGEADTACAAVGWDGGRLSADAAGECVGAAALTAVRVTLSVPSRPCGSDGLAPFALEAISASGTRWRSWGGVRLQLQRHIQAPWMAVSSPGQPRGPLPGYFPGSNKLTYLEVQGVFQMQFFF